MPPLRLMIVLEVLADRGIQTLHQDYFGSNAHFFNLGR